MTEFANIMITLDNITLQRGTKVLLEGTSVSFYDQQKIGIVGKNGCGKSSLFLLIEREIESSSGDVKMPSQVEIVTVEQEIPNSVNSAIEYVIDADIKLRKYEQDLALAQANNDGAKIAAAYEGILSVDGLAAKARAAKIIKGLGLTESEMNGSVNALSGGVRMRLNIARALFVPSDILLLDEPINHLDLDAVIWLEAWLKHYNGLLLLISHDREFLNQIATHIAHIENRKIKLYTGNYSDFETEYSQSLLLQQKQYEKQQKQIAHIESYIKRFRYKASKARQAQSRIKALEKMKKIVLAHVDSGFDFEFKMPTQLASPLITFAQVSFAYDKAPVLNAIDFQLNAGDRIGLLGKNGAGKSTFIKLLAAELKPNSGRILKNSKLKIGYFTQHTLDLLNAEKSALAHLQQYAENESELNLRKFLGRFAFSGDMVEMPVEDFSGGEKARLALALIVWQAPNILLLDEPTNHLDMDMRQALILAIQSYEGAVVVVSHDQFLLNQVVDSYYLIQNHVLQFFAGDVNNYRDLLNSEQTGVNKKKKELTNAEQKSDANFSKQQLKKYEKQLSILQKELEKLDKKLIELSAVNGDATEELRLVAKKRADIQDQYRECEELWLQAAEDLTSVHC